MLNHGNLNYLVFETLSETTFAANQLHKYYHPDEGYNEMLEARMRRVLSLCYAKGVKIISNMGSANPPAALEKVIEISRSLGLKGLKVAMVQGEDIMAEINRFSDSERWQNPGKTLAELKDKILYANVYLGATPIKEALRQGADVVITGRVADPSLFVGPLMHEFGWPQTDLERMGQATLLGHLLECCGQITGGYYAYPGYKEVDRLAYLGHPIAEIDETGVFTITKVEGSGGEVSLGTCKEQLLYEIDDPSCYKTPDAVVDFTGVTFVQAEKDVVRVRGAISRGLPKTLKVNVGYWDGYLFNGEVCFAGLDALRLAQCCGSMLQERIRIIGITPLALRMDYVGYNSLCLSVSDHYAPAQMSEVRLRIAARFATREDAELLGLEMGFLYTNGPAGSCGVRTEFRPDIRITSIFIPPCAVTPQVTSVTV
jgi:hypothetical protein